MSREAKRGLASALYIVAAALYLMYFLFELDPDFGMGPVLRVLLLCLGCASFFYASRLLSKTTTPHRAKRVMRISFEGFFALYLLLLLTFTLFDDAFGRNHDNSFILFDFINNREQIAQSVNLVPFETISLYVRSVANGNVSFGEFAVNILGNLFAFTPFALFLPLLSERCNKWYRFVLVVALCVAAIELLQLAFSKGSCDIDDLLLNTAGALCAFFFFTSRDIRAFIDAMTFGAFTKTE